MTDQPAIAATHPRDTAIEAAVGELIPWLSEWKARHDLTAVEYDYILCVLHGRLAQAMCLAEREHLSRKQ